MKVAFWPFDSDRDKEVGSSRIRCRWPIKYWQEAEEYKIAKKYDVIIFQKIYFGDFLDYYKGIKILDLCDPDWLSGLWVKEVIEKSDAVTCSSEGLYNFIKTITKKPVRYIRDRLDLEIMKQKKIHKGSAKSVIWYGYSHNAHTLQPTIRRLKEYGLKLIIVSDNNPTKEILGTMNADYKDNVSFYPYSIKTINDFIVKADIVLLPPSLKPNARFKSDNKITNARALNMPVAINSDDLFRLLSEEERIKETDKHYIKTRMECDIRKSVEEYKQLIKEIQDGKKSNK